LKKLIPSLSGGFTIGLSLFYGYILIRSRLNDYGWVAVMEPNNLILSLELILFIPMMALTGAYTIYKNLWGKKNFE